MLRSINLRNAVFGAGVLGALAFGSAQALAAPGAAAATEDTLCDDTICTALCITKGYHYGMCDTISGCVCYRLYE